MITLNSSNLTATIDTTAGSSGVIASSGTFAGARVNLFYALAGAPTVFTPLPGGSFGGHFALGIIFPGSKLMAEVIGAAAGTSINIETAA